MPNPPSTLHLPLQIVPNDNMNELILCKANQHQVGLLCLLLVIACQRRRQPSGLHGLFALDFGLFTCIATLRAPLHLRTAPSWPPKPRWAAQMVHVCPLGLRMGQPHIHARAAWLRVCSSPCAAHRRRPVRVPPRATMPAACVVVECCLLDKL